MQNNNDVVDDNVYICQQTANKPLTPGACCITETQILIVSKLSEGTLNWNDSL